VRISDATTQPTAFKPRGKGTSNGDLMIPGQVAHHSGMKPPSHSEIIPPTVPI
jgi:hypothetical protein